MISEKLIKGLKLGDKRSQEDLYELTVNRLYNVIYRMVVNHHSTQDLLQESFLKIFKNIDKLDTSKGSAYSWMCRICINTSITFLKKKHLHFEDLEDVLSLENCEFSGLQKLEAEYILDFIKKLPTIQRTIFNLYEIEGYKHHEISALLGINVNSCRTYLSRAKNKLQQQLNQTNQFKSLKVI